MLIRAKRALVSVYDKSGLKELVSLLALHNIEIISTGNTYKTIKNVSQNVIQLAEYTGSPEILEGRVKTLHPKIHAGLLADRSNPEHVSFMQQNQILFIDLVIVNFYPFQSCAKLENIDIGGPAIVRAGAKNYSQVCVLADSSDYAGLKQELEANGGATTHEFRREMAKKAFCITAQYDAWISTWFGSKKEQKEDLGEDLRGNIFLGIAAKQKLRYGENPHQESKFYTSINNQSQHFRQLQGKELSYNNMVDADSGIKLVNDFAAPTVAIIKHNNPCGVGCAKNIEAAYQLALQCDPISSFGGVVACNKKVNKALAEKIIQIFTELVVAPGFDRDALSVFSAKKNLRVLSYSHYQDEYEVRAALGGFLLQTQDNKLIEEADCRVVSDSQPTTEQIKDMIFAQRVCKHVRSNAVVVVGNQRTLGIGSGQMSRIDSVKIAVSKNSVKGAVLASDGFFPFPDCIVHSAKSGISAILQPGGSIRDQEIIDVANKHNIVMVFTGYRHFRH
ncbi:bifunctional purine biosynthesis protein PurH [Rickettsiales bacterium]|nr:bifunctional purine biosynthesis protein PurH [Rickettsiales bacterium]